MESVLLVTRQIGVAVHINYNIIQVVPVGIGTCIVYKSFKVHSSRKYLDKPKTEF